MYGEGLLFPNKAAKVLLLKNLKEPESTTCLN